MSGPFRELFVELPQALLEAAIKQAQLKAEPAPRQESLTTQLGRLIDERWLGDYLCGRYAWRKVATWREPMDAMLRFRVVMQCGHKVKFGLFESIIEATHPTAILDEIDAEWERARFRRRCYCVQVTP